MTDRARLEQTARELVELVMRSKQNVGNRMKDCADRLDELLREAALLSTPAEEKTLSLHRCKVCGTRWLLWPDDVHGGGWNLLDSRQRPGACCDNAPMGEQIEHLRDISLVVPVPNPHRCSGCGLRWEGPLKGAELCGDCWRKGQPAILGASTSAGPPQYPIPLNDAQRCAIKCWAADDRLWTTQETVEFNLRTLARTILSLSTPAPAQKEQIDTDYPHGNWHAIEGPNGMCACGPTEGCPERLRRFIRRAIDFWHAKANFLERERERAAAELPDAFERMHGSLALKIRAYRQFMTPYVTTPAPAQGERSCYVCGNTATSGMCAECKSQGLE